MCARQSSTAAIEGPALPSRAAAGRPWQELPGTAGDAPHSSGGGKCACLVGGSPRDANESALELRRACTPTRCDEHGHLIVGSRRALSAVGGEGFGEAGGIGEDRVSREAQRL